MPAVTIKPTLEYDNKPHTLKGPLLADVLKASGVKLNDKTTVFARAVDGYAAQITAAELSKYRFIVATHMDGQPLSLGGLGPLWVVYDADRFPDMAPLLVPVAIWIYTLVFAFSSLWFAHYTLAALEQLRKRNNALAPDPLIQAEVTTTAAELAPEALPGPAPSFGTLGGKPDLHLP